MFMAVDDMRQTTPKRLLRTARSGSKRGVRQTRAATMKAGGEPGAPRLVQEQSRERTLSCLRGAASKNPNVLNFTQELENTFLGIENKTGAAPGGIRGPTPKKGTIRDRARGDGRVFIPGSAGRTS